MIDSNTVLKIRKDMKKDLNITNINLVPKLEKIVINVGVGRATKDSKFVENAFNTIKIIAGQSPTKNEEKKSIAGFSLREGQQIGVKVTLRGNRMYSFLDNLINFVLPRIRDFQGLNTSAFDRQGNFSIGIKEHTIFPEIDVDDQLNTMPLQINFVIKNGQKEYSEELLSRLGIPLREGVNSNA